LRRTFDLVLTNKEIGALVQAYRMPKSSRINCADFLKIFLRLGSEARFAKYQEKLKLHREYAKSIETKDAEKLKPAALPTALPFAISYNFTDDDYDNANAKLLEASIRYDRARSYGMEQFEREILEASDFFDILVKALNVKLNAAELGALVSRFGE
jgi:hypothetical protein